MCSHQQGCCNRIWVSTREAHHSVLEDRSHKPRCGHTPPEGSRQVLPASPQLPGHLTTSLQSSGHLSSSIWIRFLLHSKDSIPAALGHSADPVLSGSPLKGCFQQSLHPQAGPSAVVFGEHSSILKQNRYYVHTAEKETEAQKKKKATYREIISEIIRSSQDPCSWPQEAGRGLVLLPSSHHTAFHMGRKTSSSGEKWRGHCDTLL